MLGNQFLVYLIFSFVILLPCFGQGQDTIKTYYLGEVEVVAHRAGGEVLNLPMAVTMVDYKDISLKRKLSLSDILNVPGVLVQSRAGAQDVRITVRGFGSRGYGDKSNAGTIRGVKILVDGFPETEPDGRTSLDFVDLLAVERVEVIRSNSSTLLGNASGGIINFETLKPRNSFFELISTVGSFGLFQSNLKVGRSFENGEALVYGTLSNFDGWRENSAMQKKQIYSVLRLNVDKRTSFRIITGFALNLFHIPGPLTFDEFVSNPKKANAVYLKRKERRYNRIGKIGINLTSFLGQNHTFETRLYFVPKVLQRSERNTFRDFNRYFLGTGLTYTYSNESAILKPKVFIGYDDSYQDGTILFYNLKDGERGDSLRTNKREGARSGGVFARFEFQPFDGIIFSFGGRYDFQKYLSEIYPAGINRATQRDVLTLNHFTPSLSILFKVNKNSSVYLTLSGGVENPAFNEVDPPPELSNVHLNPFLKPMSSQTWELGFKGASVFENFPVSGFLYSFSIFQIKIQNEIVPYANGSWFFSAGESRRRGFEFGGELDFNKWADLKFALTYIGAKYIKYENDLGDHANKFVPGIPKLWGNIDLKFDFKPFILSSEVLYVGKYFADDANEIDVPDYVIVNVSGGLEFKVASFKISAVFGVNNLTNKKYISSVFINPERRLPYAYIEPGLPRNWFGGVSIRFDAE
ncbi:MAG: TonB-dependent receptor family protein [Candidatus Kryptonium sp.]